MLSSTQLHDLLLRAFAAGLAWMLLALTVPSVANASVDVGATVVASVPADALRFLVFRFLATGGSSFLEASSW